MVLNAEDDDKMRQLDLFLSIGLDKRTAENALVNPKVSSNLAAVIKEALVVDGCSKAVGNLLYMVATKFPSNAIKHRPKLLEYVVLSKIKTPAQLEAAFTFFTNVGSEDYQLKEFEQACGVGVVVSLEEVHAAVTEVLKENMNIILEQRYRINVGNLCGQVRKREPWADAKTVKDVIDESLRGILGERTADDDAKALKKKKEKPAQVEDKTNSAHTLVTPSEEELNPFSIFPQPEENSKLRVLSSMR
ncbi:hypothetical protein HPP92_021427 [Vanilla planifolia]|uniref:Glutaminyl-tRNA synthetase class Ib non-specific RNA-binding domain-containing protein n=1 Tax=Vanilla planifolia TaxID=51239 RepID=A0A835PYN8_VANPL|nr:hypothetical protein HPP92_021427 [Vanilla planifolia]